MDNARVPGLRMFLLITLEMISRGESEQCSMVEDELANGIATVVYKKYALYFQDRFDTDNLRYVDEYYKQWSGCADGKELGLYLCRNNDGLPLLVALALNCLY